MPPFPRAARDTYLVDARMYSIPGFLSVYWIAAERPALMEGGQATSAPAILEGIWALGFNPQEAAYIFVSHLHMDHYGGAGHLLQEMPRARVVIHQRSARHLVDPSRIISAILQSEGEEWLRRGGAPRPAPPDRPVA